MPCLTCTLPVEFTPDAILASCIDHATKYRVDTSNMTRATLVTVARNCNYTHVSFDAKGGYKLITKGVA